MIGHVHSHFEIKGKKLPKIGSYHLRLLQLFSYSTETGKIRGNLSLLKEMFKFVRLLFIHKL